MKIDAHTAATAFFMLLLFPLFFSLLTIYIFSDWAWRNLSLIGTAWQECKKHNANAIRFSGR